MVEKKKATHTETPGATKMPDPIPEDGTQMEDSDTVSDEDRARGYSIGRWNGHPNFTAVDGSMATLDEQQIRAHVRRRGLTRE